MHACYSLSSQSLTVPPSQALTVLPCPSLFLLSLVHLVTVDEEVGRGVYGDEEVGHCHQDVRVVRPGPRGGGGLSCSNYSKMWFNK